MVSTYAHYDICLICHTVSNYTHSSPILADSNKLSMSSEFLIIETKSNGVFTVSQSKRISNTNAGHPAQYHGQWVRRSLLCGQRDRVTPEVKIFTFLQKGSSVHFTSTRVIVVLFDSNFSNFLSFFTGMIVSNVQHTGFGAHYKAYTGLLYAILQASASFYSGRIRLTWIS